MTFRADISEISGLASQLDHLRKLDVGAHDLYSDLLSEIKNQQSAAHLTSLCDLVLTVAAEAPVAARVLVQRLNEQPNRISETDALRRWALHGLTLSGSSMSRHFEKSDPWSYYSGECLQECERVEKSCDGMRAYLNGLGVDDVATALHDPAGNSAQYLRAKILPDMVLFPRRAAADDGQGGTLLSRAILAHAAGHLRFSLPARAIGNRKPELIAVNALLEDARVERLMLQTCPGLHSVWGYFHTASKSISGFDFTGLMARLSRALHDPQYDDPNAWVIRGRELFEAAAADLNDIDQFERVARELTNMIAKMRFALPRDHIPAPAYRDDNSYLWTGNTALPVDEEEEPEKKRQRRNPPSADCDDEVVAHAQYIYPEWDHQLNDYRENWVTLIEEIPQRASPAARRSVVSAAPGRQMHQLSVPDRSIKLTRLEEGDDLDLDQVVSNIVDRRSGLAPEGRVFQRHGRRPRSCTTIVLMDLSVSTEKFVPKSFTKIIDLEKRTSISLVKALENDDHRVAIHGFSSNGRQHVHYDSIKHFSEPLDHIVLPRIARRKSRWSTRMGAAIRHATTLLGREQAAHKTILLLTDGRPSDIDVFDDDYLIEDARESVATAMNNRVQIFCLTLDRNAGNYVQRIFGSRSYMIADGEAGFDQRAQDILIRMMGA